MDFLESSVITMLTQKNIWYKYKYEKNIQVQATFTILKLFFGSFDDLGLYKIQTFLKNVA